MTRKLGGDLKETLMGLRVGDTFYVETNRPWWQFWRPRARKYVITSLGGSEVFPAADEQHQQALASYLANLTQPLPEHPQFGVWLPIESAPRDVEIDTFGEFLPYHSSVDTYFIREARDTISSNSPYPLMRTQHQFQDMCGVYTRTHWMPLPTPPKGE